MKPLIGIAPAHLLEGERDWVYNTMDYNRAIEQAGGIPVLLPFVTSEAEAAEVLDRVDGLLISGGDDIDPLIYGELPIPQTGYINPMRDISELAYARVAMERDMALLGICRGHQVIAVAFGGTLYQDIPTQVEGAIKHRQEGPKWYPTHPVTIPEGTRLNALLGPQRMVNSRHHQAVKRAPEGWTVSATAPDGVIEALEHPGSRFAMAFQWHPENFQGRPDGFHAIFRAFVQASQQSK